MLWFQRQQNFQPILPLVTASLYLPLLVKINTELAQVVASNVNAEPELLRDLAVSGDDATRQNVVSNPNTPTDVLWELGNDFYK